MFLIVDSILLGMLLTLGFRYGRLFRIKCQYGFIILFGIFWLIWVGIILYDILLRFKYGIRI